MLQPSSLFMIAMVLALFAVIYAHLDRNQIHASAELYTEQGPYTETDPRAPPPEVYREDPDSGALSPQIEQVPGMPGVPGMAADSADLPVQIDAPATMGMESGMTGGMDGGMTGGLGGGMDGSMTGGMNAGLNSGMGNAMGMGDSASIRDPANMDIVEPFAGEEFVPY